MRVGKKGHQVKITKKIKTRISRKQVLKMAMILRSTMMKMDIIRKEKERNVQGLTQDQGLDHVQNLIRGNQDHLNEKEVRRRNEGNLEAEVATMKTLLHESKKNVPLWKTKNRQLSKNLQVNQCQTLIPSRK
jgi:hypothetical protein